jgi:hypothetical protein
VFLEELQRLLGHWQENPMFIFRPSLLLCFFSSVILIFQSCNVRENDSNISGFLDKSNASLWKDTSISVCWEESSRFVAHGQMSTFADRKESIQKAVTSEYNKTLIRFAGWGVCNEKSMGIRIRYGFERPAVKGIGAVINGLPAGMELSEADTCGGRLPLEACILYNAIHEFGHALGLRHEHERVESCENITEKNNSDGVPVGKYDKDSVMNYCLNYTCRTTHPSLSSEDINTIRIAYTELHSKMSQPLTTESCTKWKFGFNSSTSLCQYNASTPDDCNTFAQVVDSLTLQCREAFSEAECKTIPASYGVHWSQANGCTTIPDL